MERSAGLVRKALVVALALLAHDAAAVVLAPFQESTVISGLAAPTAVRFAPDGRIFVAEQSGLVKVYDGLGDTTPDIAADLRANVMNNWDRGLLSLAVDPQFPAPDHDYVYVLYSVDAPPGQQPPVWNDMCADQTSAGCPTRGRLSRLRISPTNVQIGPEEVLVDDRWCFQFPSHAIGDLRFGPEGALYATAGDGASFGFADHGQNGNPCGDPMGGPEIADDEGGSLRSQDLLTSGDPTGWTGALVRLDVRGPVVQPWPDNPLVGVGAADDDAIIAHGFRNPFRIAIAPAPLATAGEVWVADVGAGAFEEIDRVASVAAPVENFGWPCHEGAWPASSPNPGYDALDLDLCEGLYDGSIPGSVAPPFYAYAHADQVVPNEGCGVGGSAITGIAFYAAGTYPPEYQGAVFFQDLGRRCIWALLPDVPGGVPNPSNRRSLVWNAAGSPVDLQVGPGGDLYYLTFDRGEVVRIRHFGANQPPVADLEAAPTSGPAPLGVAFDASGSADANPDDTLTYIWDLDGDGQFDDAPGADPRFAEFTYTQAGAVTAAVRVTDPQLAQSAASVVISVANSPPLATITEPLETTLWRVGDTIFFAGGAVDPDEGALPPAALLWRAILHHCETPEDCHEHHLQDFAAVAQGSLVAPDHGYPAFLELVLEARDSGLADWHAPLWPRRRRLWLDNSELTAGLSGFPLLVTLDASRIDYGLTQNAGQDLRFFDPDGTSLPHEIERWDESGTSLVWVRVPEIADGTSPDSLSLYYGNALAADGQSPEAVWDASHRGVWHLDASLQDSTENQNDGASSGATVAPGRIGFAQSFDGDDWIDLSSSATLAVTGELTVEAWVRIDDPGQAGAPRVLSKKYQGDSPHGYELVYTPASNEVAVVGSGADVGRATGVSLDTGWHYLAATVTGAEARVFVDGVNWTTDATVSELIYSPQPLHLGHRSGGADYFRGDLDEVRVSRVARSEEWIAAQYRSMTDSLLVYGPEEQSSSLAASDRVLLAPETRSIGFATSPPGLDLTVGSAQQTTPFLVTLIANSATTVSAPSPQAADGTPQLFSAWSDGGAHSHEVVATAELVSLVATFASIACGDGALDGGEECDDGNLLDGDCCSAICRIASGDADADGLCDAVDNCANLSNPGQLDTGGVGVFLPDGIGDACQCGDGGDDGAVDVEDWVRLARQLAGLGGGVLAPAKCSAAAPSDCDAEDALRVREALAGLAAIEPVCVAALT